MSACLFYVSVVSLKPSSCVEACYFVFPVNNALAEVFLAPTFVPTSNDPPTKSGSPIFTTQQPAVTPYGLPPNTPNQFLSVAELEVGWKSKAIGRREPQEGRPSLDSLKSPLFNPFQPTLLFVSAATTDHKTLTLFLLSSSFYSLQASLFCYYSHSLHLFFILLVNLPSPLLSKLTASSDT